MKEKDILAQLSAGLGIAEPNEIQKRMLRLSSERRDFILLSPTGSGKTIAFSLPLMKWLKQPSGRLQSVIIAPSRELVQQIHSVVNALAKGYKVTPLYGGHKVEDEVNSLAGNPDIVVATPGRLLDHIRRRNVDVLPVRIVVLDEFDKSLELGFEEDMKKIVARMKNASRFMLTSATKADILPDFLDLNDPMEVNFLGNHRDVRSRMKVMRVDSDSNDKLESLLALLRSVTAEKSLLRTIVFVNYRESAVRVADFLRRNKVDAALYHGQLDQRERETALALFNNGSAPVLVATDLAARGLDIRNVENIIHYHQPLTSETNTHRNGRTARVDASGDIFMLIGPEEEVKPFVEIDQTYRVSDPGDVSLRSGFSTIWFGDGRREKLSKGDILGFLTKTCGLTASEVGKIEVFDHYSLVAVASDKARSVVQTASSTPVKGRKRRVSILTL